jgi:hypothetical protein
MADGDRRVLDQYRQQTIGKVPFEARVTFLAGAAGLVTGFVWLGLFHWGDKGAPFWPIIAVTAVGAAVGRPIDLARTRRRLKERRAIAAAEWDPVVSVGVVEHVVAEASRAVRIDDNQANTAWFLQVAADQILCVWAWADDATEHVEVDLVPGTPPTVLKVSWAGRKLTPSWPKRKFRRGEREPEQCEILSGDLAQLGQLLAKAERSTPEPDRSPTPRAQTTPGSKLANEAEPLGFYKYISADQIAGAKAEIDKDAYAWFLGAERAFDADCERLAEGGVKDLLDYMRSALATEGVELGDIEESYEPGNGGYVLTIGADRHTMWSDSEATQPRSPSTWSLTTTRAAGLINQWLTESGSQERVHLLHAGEDGVFVLLTPSMQDLIVKSGVFRGSDVPAPL